MYQLREGWKETTYWHPDIARNSGEKIESLKENVKMKCHRCKKEFNNLKEDIWIDKGKLRCKGCDSQLNKENIEEYLKSINDATATE